MRLKSIELSGFKSFAKKTELKFDTAVTSIVGPNGSGKSNIAESFRFVLGEQSMKSMRGKRGEDLIWNGSPMIPRAGRASVKLTFDNPSIGGRRVLNVDFDEVTIERVVHRDGGNEYLLNNSPVRLRDIVEMLSYANIGASGHHIISQGEADRALSATARDRREMIEDALGLTSYFYKRAEAEKKLEKTAENIREVEGLRRELAPHLRFLEKQVKKIEESEKLRDAVKSASVEYLAREKRYISAKMAHLERERSGPQAEKRELDAQVARLRLEVEAKGAGDKASAELIRLEKEESAARARRDTLSREIGRLEGEMVAHERMLEQQKEGTVPAREAAQFAESIVHALEGALHGDLSAFRKVAEDLLEEARAFVTRAHREFTGAASKEAALEMKERKAKLEQEMHEIIAHEKTIAEQITELRRSVESEKDASRDAERNLFAAMARRTEVESLLSRAAAHEEELNRDRQAFADDLREAGVLVGSGVFAYEEYQLLDEIGVPLQDEDILRAPREEQLERRRKLERMKIRLEESGAGNAAEVEKEYKETSERDAFLERELADLSVSIESLRSLIDELTSTLKTKFSEGIDMVSKQFDEYFKILFGGGSAHLSIVKEKKPIRRSAEENVGEELDDGEADADEEEYEDGVEIQVSLPLKRVKGLHMLSGGERALTSIALIFAMSQVNPPPFLILDETDAALDEANSRRYGDMIETLAKKSQLILITHNRETMSRAGILYGITMGSDGASKLLSVRFEEAVAVAK